MVKIFGYKTTGCESIPNEKNERKKNRTQRHVPCSQDDPNAQANQEDSKTSQAQQKAQTQTSQLQLWHRNFTKQESHHFKLQLRSITKK